MPERISRKQFERRLANLQKQGFDLGYDSQLGGVRVTNKSESRSYSARGTAGQGYEFLRGVETGINAERERVQKAYPTLVAYLREKLQHDAPDNAPGLFQEMENFIASLSYWQ